MARSLTMDERESESTTALFGRLPFRLLLGSRMHLAPRWPRAATHGAVMLPKRFFHLCTGLFLLAMIYDLRSSSAQARAPALPQEVAVSTGHRDDGQIIPLPTYGNGTQAIESDCKWSVSLRDFPVGTVNILVTHCSADSRVVSACVCADPCVPTDPSYSHCSVNYIIVATRATGAVSTKLHRLGQLKQLYRWQAFASADIRDAADRASTTAEPK